MAASTCVAEEGSRRQRYLNWEIEVGDGVQILGHSYVAKFEKL